MDDAGLVISSSDPSTATGRRTYDVFINFCSEDTGDNFVNHLYAALDQVGIYTFKDDKELTRGESISPERMKAIEESRVAVVVFSVAYAKYYWCLDELEKIVECHDLIGQKVLPVFYHVKPSSFFYFKRSFHGAFEHREKKLTDDMEKVKSWSKALRKADKLRGWVVGTKELVLLALFILLI